jgi:hypothetical protein
MLCSQKHFNSKVKISHPCKKISTNSINFPPPRSRKNFLCPPKYFFYPPKYFPSPTNKFRSNYFRKHFEEELRIDPSPLGKSFLKFPAIKTATFLCILEWLYTGNVERIVASVPRRPPKDKAKPVKPPAPLDVDFAFDLLTAASTFELRPLQELTEIVISVSVDLSKNVALSSSALQYIVSSLSQLQVTPTVFTVFCGNVFLKYFETFDASDVLTPDVFAKVISNLPLEVFRGYALRLICEEVG